MPTVEQYTHTKTCASSACKNTPRNSIVRRAVTQKFTQNAQQTSQRYSRSQRTIIRWNADSSLIVTVSGYMYKNIILINTLKQLRSVIKTFYSNSSN